MKLTAFLLALGVAASVHADRIRLADGKEITGTVTGYANMAFEITLENGSEVRQAASAIKSIEFSSRPARFELRGKKPVEGNLSSFANGAFTLQTEDGKTETVPAMLIVGSSFSGSTKKYMVVLGGGALDLKKILAPGKITLVLFTLESSGPCKAVFAELDKLIKEDPDLVLRKVDVVKLSTTPVCKQFDIKSVPRTHIYDRNGKLTGFVTGPGKDAILAYIRAAKEAN